MQNRRNFLKTMFASVAAVGIAAVIPPRSSFPETVVKKQEKHPKDVLACRSFSPQITIRDYSLGETVKWQDLRVANSCQMCCFEKNCTCNGRKFIAKTDNFVPEIWNDKVMRRAYEKFFLGKI